MAIQEISVADTAPFAEYADEIRTLVIEDGITYIGSCLFYGLGGLQGELILPESIVGIGDYAFSGESPAQAARFTVIRNEFEGGEITEWKKAEPEESETITLATPSQAEKVTSEERIEEGEQNGEADKTEMRTLLMKEIEKKPSRKLGGTDRTGGDRTGETG